MCVHTNMYSSKFFPLGLECSLSIRQQKHKMKEILFCSNVWEKHLEESWWEGVRCRVGECEEDKECVRGDLSVLDFMDFFFFFAQSVNFTQPAEIDHHSAQSAELDFKVNGYWSHGHKENLTLAKNKKCNVPKVLSRSISTALVWKCTVCVCMCVCVLSQNDLMNAPDTTPSKYSVKLFIAVLFVLLKETRLNFKNRRSERLWLHLQWMKKY